ncbi:methylase [Paramagnetospirillum caucaseum]|uniref:Methylase n=1 Tax=Paramagnetospirillum caucaseum TaxID=1244869 RepID=M2Z4N1_9PROT|nr:class I SAM-dependent methyltransferase [Paramagnetospirillum caucaseum]EME69320.1 methylase [Paramagnetospirillum caucaseum]
MSSLLREFHRRHFTTRRAEVLAARIAALLPQGASVLDVGCGNGLVESLMLRRRPDLSAQGVDIRIRPECLIPAREYDGKTIPLADDSVDYAMIIDVLHHTDDPEVLMREACRVARKGLVIKDHLIHGLFAESTLKLMDWAGNAPYGTVLTYNFWAEEQWRAAWLRLGLRVTDWQGALGIYGWPLTLMCDRSLHFLARLDKAS